MKSFVTSDNHFGHENIIRFCNRPFKNVEDMNATMIERWNDVVGDHDMVYHLGDLTLNGQGYANDIISQLNGLIYFITPNWHHDKRWYRNDGGHVSKSGHKVVMMPALHLLKYIGHKITLCHYPMEEWEASFHGTYHFHGHSHGNAKEKPWRFDVGVDVWGFTPIEIDYLLELGQQIWER